MTEPTATRDAELRQLADRLDREAALWRLRGLWRLSDQLRAAAATCRGWVGADDDGAA